MKLVIEEIISYNFNDKKLLQQALTHPSTKRKGKLIKDYERLEFLGDSVLGFLIAEIVYKKYPDEKEGELAKRKAAIVSKATLSLVARDISLGEYLILSSGEDTSGGRENDANLEDALEALIGAMFIDGGIEKARKFVFKFFAKYIKSFATPPKDPKSKLQELLQAKGKPIPTYKIISMEGPSHEPTITVRAVADGEAADAVSTSKKDAEVKAAKLLLKILQSKIET